MIKHLLEQCKNVPEYVKMKLASLNTSSSTSTTTTLITFTTFVHLLPPQPFIQNIQFLKSKTSNQPKNSIKN